MVRRQSNNANTNVNTKSIEGKHFIHYLKRFPQTCFVMPTYEHKYQCFFILVQGFSARTFSRIIDCFHCRLSSVWSYIFLLIAQTRSQNKTTFTTTKSHECLQWTAVIRVNWLFCGRSLHMLQHEIGWNFRMFLIVYLLIVKNYVHFFDRVTTSATAARNNK